MNFLKHVKYDRRICINFGINPEGTSGTISEWAVVGTPGELQHDTLEQNSFCRNLWRNLWSNIWRNFRKKLQRNSRRYFSASFCIYYKKKFWINYCIVGTHAGILGGSFRETSEEINGVVSAEILGWICRVDPGRFSSGIYGGIARVICGRISGWRNILTHHWNNSCRNLWRNSYSNSRTTLKEFMVEFSKESLEELNSREIAKKFRNLQNNFWSTPRWNLGGDVWKTTGNIF